MSEVLLLRNEVCIMNIKNILFLAIFLFAVNSTMALEIKVWNASDFVIEVEPVWSGSQKGVRQIQPRLSSVFNSSIYSLQKLFVTVKYQGKNLECYAYDFERNNLKGTGSILLSVGQAPFEFGQIIVQGQTMAGIKGSKINPFGVSASTVKCK
jgi:hypothetical protein